MDQLQHTPARLPNSSLNDRLIMEQLMRLMQHFWLPNEDPAMLKAKYEDWLADLGEFPASIVADACAMWRRTEGKRPTPSDIRKLCAEMRPAQRPALPSPQRSQRPADHIVREDFMLLSVRDWTRAELAQANADLDAKAEAVGMTRMDYVKANLGVRGYSASPVLGSEGETR